MVYWFTTLDADCLSHTADSLPLLHDTEYYSIYLPLMLIVYLIIQHIVRYTLNSECWLYL
jgi:hypothetical protein